MSRMLLSISGLGLVCVVSGCSAGKALVFDSPAKKHTPAQQLAHVGAAYEARGDYETAAETYRQALQLEPGDRRLQRQLANAERLSDMPESPTDPYEGMRSRSVLAADRRSEDMRQRPAMKTVSAPVQPRLRQMVRKAAEPRIEEPEDWDRRESELDGFTDEELEGMESPLNL